MLSVNLESKGPEVTFPNLACLCILKSKVVFLIDTGRADAEVEIGNVEPERYHTEGSDDGPHLEPTFRVYVVKSPI